MPEIAANSDLILTTVEAQTRWYYEREKLRLFPSFALLGTNAQITAAEGAIESQNNNTYRLRIVLMNYPYALPKVYPVGWTIHPAAPHKFADGSICIMRSDQWRQQFTVALVVAKAAIWLGKYEIWKRNGHTWPGLGQHH
jgi:hypothetical protein